MKLNRIYSANKYAKNKRRTEQSCMSNWSAVSTSTLMSCILQCLKLSKDRRNIVLETWVLMFILPTPNTAHHFINMQVFISSTYIKACEEMRTRESPLSHQVDFHTGRTPDPPRSILSTLRRPTPGLMLFRPGMLISILKWKRLMEIEQNFSIVLADGESYLSENDSLEAQILI